MEHVGQIVERVVRRSGISVTELALRMHVNRKSIYNWFAQRYLSFDIVYQIGCVMGHDFLTEFPDNREDLCFHSEHTVVNEVIEDADYWKDKYIELLEKYNNQLESEQNMKPDSVKKSARR